MATVPSEPRPAGRAEATAAGVYDYLLGGDTHSEADAEVAGQLIGAMPMVGRLVMYNRAFLQRAVRFLCATGVRQFLDLGSGVPTVGNVHEVAQEIIPGARVVYVDHSAPAVEIGRELLAGNPDATSVLGDLREPDRILEHPEVRALVDFDQPVAILMIAVLHFMGDDERPIELVEGYARRLAAGSYLVITHGNRENDSGRLRAQQDDFSAAYNNRVMEQGVWRPAAEIRKLFGPAELVEPGLVYLPDWRPDEPGYRPDDEDEPRKMGLGGVARIG